MVGRDGKKLQLFVQRASAVSHALWPANLHKGVATGKSAQRRRFIIISASWWPELLGVSRMLLPLTLAFFSMVVGGALVASLVLSAWYLLLIPLALASVALGVVSVVVVGHVKANWRLTLQTIRRLRERSASPFSQADETPFPLLPHAPETPMPESHSLVRKTPMPVTNPFVRILETYDLSRSDVEHFLTPEEEAMGADTAEYPIYRAPSRNTASYPPPTPA